ncbi:calcium uniporter protein 2, mitochondrial-like [Phalaenopsis equestris]|uniref:calcium uniporter protein 2, mitochondrial-like n=1 Tax=Phalaenopsis equestris TaxID=78828 RepID=UPI0009E42E09|nr:calcium uniporter protein 2, mitochondrial-like [Phalaenopsis equestris]
MPLRLVHYYLFSQTRSSAGASAPLRRFLQCRPIPRPTFPASDRPSLPIGDELIKMIRDLKANRVRNDLPPPDMNYAVMESGSITAAEVKKVLRVTEMEAVKSRLRVISRSHISWSEFICICRNVTSTEENAAAIARSLDECGFVIAFRDLVILRPGEITSAIEKAIPLPFTNQKDQKMIKELMEMEGKKAEIDKKAIAGVRRELWCGLGFLAAQTLGLMRLTFWELSWDVMEPVCFFLTSTYFMAGYAFFLRTSKEPSFQGFFESRFASKQKRMMRECGFDLHRFNRLRLE